MTHYLDTLQLLDHVEEPNRSIAKNLRNHLLEECPTALWSSNNHQAWEGWYFWHITEILNYAVVLYWAVEQVRPVPFTLWDTILVLFLHDLEKPYTYTNHTNDAYKKLSDYALRDTVIKDRWFQLTDDHRNGLLYVHGEWNDHRKDKRVQWPLAAFCHCIDTISARIYFDFPKEKNW